MARTRHRRTVPKAIEQGFKRRGISHERADRVYRMLLADGPMSASEIAEHMDLLPHQITGTGAAMEHLLADGRAYSRKGHGPNRMYYATEEGEEVPCTCTGLVHKDTCPNWRLPV